MKIKFLCFNKYNNHLMIYFKLLIDGKKNIMN